ncbi:hypothetical protein TNCT_245311 [Trichonephila clavata]|uniref:Uncharacterized protein n=1 Tax=Trichonephila clavata TaxID=2740835 RepID=A0A8X6GJC5_TRICU|nr:hypothetical protein TNCT_245311 [Trichonephila clavata]
MRLWPATSRSARNSLENVRCAETAAHLGPPYLLDLCSEGRSWGPKRGGFVEKLLCGSYNVIVISITVYKHPKFAHGLFLLTLADRPMPFHKLAGQTPNSRKDRTLADHCEAILAVSRFGRPIWELADFGFWP